MPTDKLEIEISKFVKDESYSFSSEDDDKKRVYTIYSSELKKKLQAMVSPFGGLAKGNIQYKGRNSQGDRIIYKQGKDDLPDQLTLISKEAVEQEEQEMDENEKIFAEFEESMAEHERRKAEWQKREKELGLLTEYDEKHFWTWEDENGVNHEVMYIKSETQSQLTILENKDGKTVSPQIQKITVEQKNKEIGKSLTESNEKEVIFTPHHQLPPKK